MAVFAKIYIAFLAAFSRNPKHINKKPELADSSCCTGRENGGGSL